MSGISFYNTDSISTLLSFGNTSRNAGVFGNQNTNAFTGIDFSTLSSIRNGSYSKLLKAYYAKVDTSSSKTGSTTSIQKEDAQDTAAQKLNGAAVRDEAADVVDAVSAFKKNALWEKKGVTDAEGNTKQEYDKDAIYKAVSQFVSDYNTLVESTGKSSDNSVLRTASSMVNYTKANKGLLQDIGITIGSDNKLSVNEKKFKDSNMTVAKSVFTGSGSYGQTISKNASAIYSSAVAQIAKLDSATTYSNTGRYSYVTGATYNQYL